MRWRAEVFHGQVMIAAVQLLSATRSCHAGRWAANDCFWMHSCRSLTRITTSAQYSFLGGNDRLICFRSRATAAAFFRLRFAVGVS